MRLRVELGGVYLEALGRIADLVLHDELDRPAVARHQLHLCLRHRPVVFATLADHGVVYLRRAFLCSSRHPRWLSLLFSEGRRCMQAVGHQELLHRHDAMHLLAIRPADDLRNDGVAVGVAGVHRDETLMSPTMHTWWAMGLSIIHCHFSNSANSTSPLLLLGQKTEMTIHDSNAGLTLAAAAVHREHHVHEQFAHQAPRMPKTNGGQTLVLGA